MLPGKRADRALRAWLPIGLGACLAAAIRVGLTKSQLTDPCYWDRELISAWRAEDQTIDESPSGSCDKMTNLAQLGSMRLRSATACPSHRQESVNAQSVKEVLLHQGGYRTRIAIELDDSHTAALLSSEWVLCAGFSMGSVYGYWSAYDQAHRYFSQHDDTVKLSNPEATILVSETSKSDFTSDVQHILKSSAFAGQIDLMFLVGGAAAKPRALCSSELFSDFEPSVLVVEFQPFWGPREQRAEIHSSHDIYKGVSLGFIFEKCVFSDQYVVVSCLPFQSAADKHLALALLTPAANSSLPSLDPDQCLSFIVNSQNRGHQSPLRADLSAKWNRYHLLNKPNTKQ